MVDPWSAEAHRRLGDAYYDAGQQREATTQWLTALALGSAEAFAGRLRLPVAEREARMLAAGWALRAAHGRPASGGLRATLALAAARRAARAEHWPEAARAYDSPSLQRSSAAQLQRGHALKEAGDPVAAERAYRRAVALAPGWAEPLAQLAFLLKDQGRAAPAAQLFRVAAAFDPGGERPKQGLAELGSRAATVARVGWAAWLPASADSDDGIEQAPFAPPPSLARGMSARARTLYGELARAISG